MTSANKIALAGIGVAACVALFVYFRGEHVQQEDRRQDQEQRKQEAEPRLAYVSCRYENGDTILTFRNTSRRTPVAVSEIRFLIREAATLRRIQHKDPKPEHIECGAANNIDDVGFTRGGWCDEGTYGFLKYVGYHVPANGVNDFRLSIHNRMWRGETFVGTLEIYYSGSGPDENTAHVMEKYGLDDVTIKPK